MNGPIAQSRLERTPDKREVVGSIPTRPTTLFGSWINEDKDPKSQWGCSSVGRAPALHAGGHRFDPVHLHQLKLDRENGIAAQEIKAED